jgi:signal transduction histidine kinase
MTKEQKIQIIKKNPIFENLSLFELEKIAEASEEKKFNKNDIIFKENEIADAFYIIANGIVEILKSGGTSNQEVLAEKYDGAVFGEMSVIDDLPRSATGRAKTDLLLLKLNKDEFQELLKAFSHISIEIARSICSTVRQTNDSYISDLENRNKQLEIAYEKLKKTQDQLLSAERLSVVGKFSSLIIHDIKNPMSNIRAYSELIKMSNDTKNEKIEKATKVIIDEVDRLTKMTSELLEFARGEIDLNKIPVNLSSLIETLIDTVRPNLKSKNIKIVFTKKCDIVVMVDVEKIKRVFLNIVSNSADAILNGGIIVIKLSEENKWAKWTFIDNGIGIEPESIQKIFEPFYTNKKKGTGLGMPIVKSIVESHNGMIKVLSKKDNGTKFDIFLPKV